MASTGDGLRRTQRNSAPRLPALIIPETYSPSWRSSNATVFSDNESKPKPPVFPFSTKVPVVSNYAGDYDSKYPEDPHSQEFGPNARVYKVYLGEATKHDAEAIDSWKDSLDVLLIFSGLFSAVVTTLVVQLSSRLEPDYDEMNAYLQFEANALLRAISSSAPTSQVQISPRSPYTQFAPARKDAWINGLWYLSLTLALSTAMITMLVKQWLKYHVSFIPGSPQDRARIIEARRRAAHRWRLTAIIGALPLLMHAAVFAFFAGLLLLLWSWDIAIFGVITAIMSITVLFYGITTILPLIFPHCCYVTPLTLAGYAAWRSTNNFWSAFITYGGHLIKSWREGGTKEARFKHSQSATSAFRRRLREVFEWQPISHAERITALQDVDLADVHILQWLHSSASLNPSVPPIICEAISGIREGFTQLSAVRDISKTIYEDWDSEVEQLLAISHGSRLERYLRMNAVLYESSANFSILDRHPNSIGAIILASLPDEAVLQALLKTELKCCGYSLGKVQDSQQLDRAYWIHALLLMSTLGIKGTEFANMPMAKLHPAAWVNIFSYITEFARVRPDSDALRSTLRCVRKCVNLLLPTVLNHHFESPEERQPYFAEIGDETKDGAKRRVVESVTILDLPPGHSRTRFLQFLYVYSRPTDEHQFSLYVDFPSFAGNMVELWHKALLLHLKHYEAKTLDESTVGVLRELSGVLQKSAFEDKRLDVEDTSPCKGRFKTLQRTQSILEQDGSELMKNCRGKLKRALVDATFDILLHKTYPHARPNPDPPTAITPLAGPLSPIAPVGPGVSPGIAMLKAGMSTPYRAHPIIGVQLVSLIEALRRITSTKSFNSVNAPNQALFKAVSLYVAWVGPQINPDRTPGESYFDILNKAGTMFMSDVLNAILRTDPFGRTSSFNQQSPPRLPEMPHPLTSRASVQQFRTVRKALSPTESALAGLSRSLESGSQIFILSDAISLIYETLNRADGPLLNMKRAESLLVVFRTAQIISSFIEGVLKMDNCGYSEGLSYLSDSDTLNKCCKIMVWGEFALYTLNAAGVDSRRSYSFLSKLRPTTRCYLDRWWQNILSLTEKHPECFEEAWKAVFKDGTLHPRRPSKPQESPKEVSSPISPLGGASPAIPPQGAASAASFSSPISPFIPAQNWVLDSSPTVALYRKRHYLWVEGIREALDVKSPDFELCVYMTQEEYDRLSPFTHWRIAYSSARPKDDHSRKVIDFDLVKDNVGENLTAVEESTVSELGKLLIPILNASMQRRLQNRIDLEAGRNIVQSP